jgi:cobaltochelatase CobN
MVDEDVRRFLADHNPAALQEMADRFEEAQRRDLWRSRRNDVPRVLDDIRETTKR